MCSYIMPQVGYLVTQIKQFGRQCRKVCGIIMKKRLWEGAHMDTSEIKAILDEDFENLLRRLNVYDAVVNGTVTCEYCHEGITLDNISMVFPQNGQVCFCCDKKECTEQLMKQRGILE